MHPGAPYMTRADQVGDIGALRGMLIAPNGRREICGRVTRWKAKARIRSVSSHLTDQQQRDALLVSKGPNKLFDFEGSWHLRRSIQDAHAQKRGTLEGRLTFTRSPEEDGSLHYHEEGALSYGDAPPLTASRSYVWIEERGEIAVQFSDGAPFHKFSLRHTMPEATHFCDPDMYYVSYDFSKWPTWRSIWRVVGPRKDYRMTSILHRL